ncbi:MAG: 50S ribosome-binding GTPase [Planctomycetota bacterium]|jgi:tRNA modification GTPase|nr:50S ribosome-binding GTPase [Planctomycetota bacterium]
MSYFAQDNIAQIGTAAGPGWLGAIRLSGPDAFAILARVSSGLETVLAGRPERSFYPARLNLKLSCRRGGGRSREDFACPARILLLPAPRSYTREDMAELHLPGSPPLLTAGLAALAAAGAREAAPGEFTFRAFRNGRLSLGQAEAVEAVISAAREDERRAALARLGDENRRRISAWRDLVLDLAARTEAVLDFPEEELDAGVAPGLAGLAAELEREGMGVASAPELGAPALPRVALAGLVNAGKSALFNALLGENASLASPEASTTHDLLRRQAEWEGTRLVLSDLPGYHPGGDGRQRRIGDLGLERLEGEDVVCWVIDASRPPEPAWDGLLEKFSGRIVAVLHKSDLPAALSGREVEKALARRGLSARAILAASAAAGRGLEELRLTLARAAARTSGEGGWSRREALELAAARSELRAAAAEFSGAGRLELAAESLRRAGDGFSRAMGEGYAETVLARIFSRFCLGK